MARRIRARGRPTKYVLPPRIDVTAEQLAASVLRAKPKQVNEDDFPTAFNCEGCGREVCVP